LARFLVKRGYNVTVISTCENPGVSTELEGVRIICISKPIKGSRFYLREMPLFSSKAKRIVENSITSPDTILHSVYYYNLISFLSFSKLSIVITEFEHYPWIPEHLYHYPFLSTWSRIRWESDIMVRISLARMIMDRARIVIFVSKYQREMFLKKVRGIKSKTIIIPNAVDTDFFRPMKVEDLEELREGADVLLLFVGRRSPHKGLHVLLKALAMLDRSYKRRLKLIVIGPRTSGFLDLPTHHYDKYSAYLDYLIRKYDLKDVIRFVGQVNEEMMPLYYNSVDMLVHPSFVEAFGLTLIEAMACGKPVLAFNIPPINEIVINGVSGILVEPSMKYLREALHYVVDNVNILKYMGAKARNIVETRYSWHIISNIYVRLYNRLLS